MADSGRKIGIIGAGSIVFKSHLPLLRAMDADVRWVLDVDRRRSLELAKAFDVPLALGADQLALTTPVDVVLIACPYGSRASYYEFLRENPAALYVEKPIARSVAELERICAMRPDYALAAGFTRRSNGVTSIVKGLIESRVFGHLRRMRSEFGTAAVISSGAGFAKKVSLAGGGQLFESAIHNIDVICYAAEIERALVRECRMEAEGQFDLQTEASIELTDAAGRRIDLELFVTCFRNTQYEIEMEFEQAVLTFSLFKKGLPRVRGLHGRGSYQLQDADTADYPRNVFDILHVFWADFLSGIETRRANYTSARATMVTASITSSSMDWASVPLCPPCTGNDSFSPVTTIGIIGASGQVGTEVCLFLKTYPGVHPVAIVRSEISGALLRRLGVEVRLCNLDDEHRCREAFADCDLLVDFSVTPGEAADITAHYRRNITRALEYTRRDARYVFISSINAFGMGGRFNRAKNYFLPHTIYAYTKRYGERLARQLGKRHGKQIYIFRLSHVHGLLQRVSEETRQLVRSSYRRFAYPDTPSYTIFCHSIAEGLIGVAKGGERPGNYTLISHPAWTWREVLNYYVEPGREIEMEAISGGIRGGIPGRAVAALRSGAMRSLNEYRETIRTNALRHFPSFERRAAARLYTRRAAQQIQEFQNQRVYRAQGIHEGVFPGSRLTGISDSRVSMAEKTDQVREMLKRLPAPTSMSVR